MAQVINTNISSLNAQRQLNRTQSASQTALERLSSGLRINSAKDDAAGLAISDRMTTQIRGMNQAVRNAADAISMSQVGEGALQQVTNNLQRMRELSIQSRNATNTDADRQSLNAEFQQLMQANDQLAKITSFNGRNVLDGSLGNAVFQTGANVGETVSLDVSSSMRTNAIGKFSSVSFSLATDATATDTDTFVMDAGTDLTINGQAIGAANAGANGAGAGSALSIAEAINAKTTLTGVTAKVGVTTLDASASEIASFAFAVAGESDVYTLTVNGQQILTQTEGVDSPKTVAQLASSINTYSSTTGVVATVKDDGGLTLTAADGRNIEVREQHTSGGASAGGMTQGYFGNAVGEGVSNFDIKKATLSLEANRDIAVTFATAANIDDLFGVTGTASANYLAQTIDSSDILNAANADLSVRRIDQAITDVDALRGTFGALQSRFESTIASLQTSAENLSAARSRILDADFAMETANLTRAQILQQAGTAMLAQANAAPQGVLALLR